MVIAGGCVSGSLYRIGEGYIDSLFRRERPQKGRFRQFEQFGVESIGSEFPEQEDRNKQKIIRIWEKNLNFFLQTPFLKLF